MSNKKTLYLKLNDSKLGEYLDYADLALDAASMIPYVGPFAAIAGTVTGIPQGILGLHDMAINGPSVENTTDALKLVPMGGFVSMLSKKGLNMVGKSNKIVKRSHPYFTIKDKPIIVKGMNLGKTHHSGIDLIKLDKRYIPYFAPIYGMDAINLGTDAVHIYNNKKDE